MFANARHGDLADLALEFLAKDAGQRFPKSRVTAVVSVVRRLS